VNSARVSTKPEMSPIPIFDTVLLVGPDRSDRMVWRNGQHQWLGSVGSSETVLFFAIQLAIAFTTRSL